MSTVTKKYNIESLEDIRTFFKDIHELYPFEWHPDDDFKDFRDGNDARSFSDQEAEYLNSVMTICFNLCDNLDTDIYDLAGKVQIEVWKKQGIWPPEKE